VRSCVVARLVGDRMVRSAESIIVGSCWIAIQLIQCCIMILFIPSSHPLYTVACAEVAPSFTVVPTE
jgi:hypothetical protein